jgi:hypothetical protein
VLIVSPERGPHLSCAVDRYCCKDVYGAHGSDSLEVPREPADLLRNLRLRYALSITGT